MRLVLFVVLCVVCLGGCGGGRCIECEKREKLYIGPPGKVIGGEEAKSPRR